MLYEVWYRTDKHAEPKLYGTYFSRMTAAHVRDELYFRGAYQTWVQPSEARPSIVF